MDRYDMATASRNIEEFVKDLSQWYIRRSRNRFKSGDADAIGTLHYCLVLLSKISAPMIPFVAEEIYQNLVVGLGNEQACLSVHLEEYPQFTEKDIEESILTKMDTTRAICSNGLKAREEAKLNLRQPLPTAYIGVDDEVMRDIVKEELNVKEVKYSKEKVMGDGLFSAGEGTMYVSIDTKMSDDLKEEGLRNEFLRKYRDLRKRGGFKIDDVITLHLKFEDMEQQSSLEKYLNTNHEDISVKEVLIGEDSMEYDKEIVLNGKKISVLMN
jgi:isoleucyl-tRNA synthetase